MHQDSYRDKKNLPIINLIRKKLKLYDVDTSRSSSYSQVTTFRLWSFYNIEDLMANGSTEIVVIFFELNHSYATEELLVKIATIPVDSNLFIPTYHPRSP